MFTRKSNGTYFKTCDHCRHEVRVNHNPKNNREAKENEKKAKKRIGEINVELAGILSDAQGARLNQEKVDLIEANKNLKILDAVRNELNCKRCQKAVLTQEEKELLDGLYCIACRKKFGYYADSTFDDNSRVLKELVMDALPTLVDIPVSGGIAGSKTPWAGRMVKPDMAFHYGPLIVVIEADDDDGHSKSRGNNISKFGTPWKYDRDLQAERAKMQTAAQALWDTYHKPILFLRCNSDNESVRISGGDIGVVFRSRLVVEKMRQALASVSSFPANHFRLALVDMPPSRIQQGIPIAESNDVYISWLDIQQTITPVATEVLLQINGESRIRQKNRRASRQLGIE